jgi:formate dehydrogenase alpha subunit
MVELEGEGDRPLIAACARVVEKGMSVKTRTDRVLAARKTVLELLISDHPLDCLTCESSGVCPLQDYAYEYGVTGQTFAGRRHDYSPDVSNPFIQRDLSKCIKCYRCAQACQDLQFCDIADHMYRGFDTMVTTALDRPLNETDCVSCGRCVSVCPTGALVEKASIGLGRSKNMKRTATICPYCGVGCHIILETNRGSIVRVRSDDKSPVNAGDLCVKGRFGFDFVNSPDRLQQPLVRKDGQLQPASWDEALDFAAARLTEIKKRHKPDSIAILASSKCTNEDNYLMQKFARAAIGTNNIDNCARLCHSPTVVGLAAAFGSGAMTNSIEDIGEAEAFLVIGSNTTEAHPVLALRIIRAVKEKGAKLLVLEPRRIPLVKYADIWLAQKPGTDVALINGLLNVIIEEDLIDKEFIKNKTEGFAAVAKAVQKYTPEYVEKITGVPAEDIRQAARVYGQAASATIIYAMGITQHTTGVDNVKSLANLAMITGNVGRPGSGVNALRGQNNVQGACDVGALPDMFPGYQPMKDDGTRMLFEAIWNQKLSQKTGLAATEMFDAAATGDIKAMYIMGENPVLSEPDVAHTRLALKNLEFLVVQDIFLTETAEYADVVLPGCSFAEKDGTYTNTERRVQHARRARRPRGESRPDWVIIADLSSRLGYPMLYTKTSDVFKELASVTPQYRGMSFKRIETCGIHWPCPTPYHIGTPILHREGFVRGKGKFHAVEFKEPAEKTDKKYPLILTTGRYLSQFHTGTMTRKIGGLNQIAPEALLDINPVDAKTYGIKNGKPAVISTRRGSITAKARVTDTVRPGVIYLPFHYVEAAANALTNPAFDPVAKIPEFKVAAAAIRPS